MRTKGDDQTTGLMKGFTSCTPHSQVHTVSRTRSSHTINHESMIDRSTFPGSISAWEPRACIAKKTALHSYHAAACHHCNSPTPLDFLPHSHTAAGRFSLTVKLLGSSAKPTLERLFSGLQSAVLASQAAHQGKQEQPAAAEAPHEEGGSTVDPCSPTRVAALQAMYGLPPS